MSVLASSESKKNSEISEFESSSSSLSEFSGEVKGVTVWPELDAIVWRQKGHKFYTVRSLS